METVVKVRSFEASSGFTVGPPRFQPLMMFSVISRPRRSASFKAWVYRAIHSAEPNFGPAGTVSLPFWPAPLASTRRAPRNPWPSSPRGRV